jgi:cytochrome c oxidase subunit IV
MMDASHSPEAVQKQVRGYIIVFVTLMALTLITVGISYLHLSAGPAIALALIVASVKASLVASYFMHLISERKIIYGTLILTGLFLILLLLLPVSHFFDNLRG